MKNLKYDFCDVMKSTNGVAYLLLKEGGEMDYHRVLNLLYMAERLCIEKEFELYFCGSLAITPKGPVIYEIQELIEGNKVSDLEHGWSFKINKPEGYKLSVKDYIKYEHVRLHEYMEDMIDEVYDNFGDMTQDELLEFMNSNFPECKNFRINENFTPSLIDLDILVKDLGFSNKDVKIIIENIKERQDYATIFEHCGHSWVCEDIDPMAKGTI